MYDVHMACCMPYTITISIIHIIIQYFFVLNTFSVINLLPKNDGGPQTSKNNFCGPRGKKKGAYPCTRIINNQNGQ